MTTEGPQFTPEGWEQQTYQSDAAPPPSPPNDNRAPIIIAIVAVIVLLAVAGAGWIIWNRISGVEGSATAGSLASDMPNLLPTSEARAVDLPAGAVQCEAVTGPQGEFTRSARGNEVTSCPFAEEARIAYARSGAASENARTVTVYSPVTKQLYDMSCRQTAPGPLVTCTGGNDAVVYLF
jgi:hypothetical protein